MTTKQGNPWPLPSTRDNERGWEFDYGFLDEIRDETRKTSGSGRMVDMSDIQTVLLALQSLGYAPESTR